MQITLSVRALVEFILREGDIDTRIHGSLDGAMQEGSRIHRKIQKKQGPLYHAEVPLSYTLHTKRYDLVIEGRADGIEEGTPVMIDEIKGTYRSLDRMEEPDPVHLAQAKVYAAIYLLQKELNEIQVRMSYCSLDTEQMKYFVYNYSSSEIYRWFEDILSKYQVFADFQADWKQTRDASIKQCAFPFPYRKGQKELVAGVYRTIVHGKKLFLEAPTGTGKTITTIFPAVQAIGQDKAEKIFYLTAKTMTGTVAEDTFHLLRMKEKLRFKTIAITAKDKICFKKEAECNPAQCPYAKGHYDRINNAMYDLMTHEDNYSRETIQYYAQKHQVCPFEFSLDMSLFADGIVCDYNYAFDPFVYLKRYFGDGGKGNYIFLMDEAHNLVDRGRNMYSAELLAAQVQDLHDQLISAPVPFKGNLTSLLQIITGMADTSEKPQILESIEPLVQAADRLSGGISEYLDEYKEGVFHEDILEFYFALSRFLTIYDLLDEHYRIYQEWDAQAGFRIRLLCVDPSANLAMCMDRAVSTILFSATFLPIQYYKEILGGTPEDFEMYADSIFDPARRSIVVAKDVTSRYAVRGQEQYERTARYIHQILQQKRGNYMVFFPSHLFLEEVYDVYMEKYVEEDDVELLAQGTGMSEEEREAFLSRFSEGNTVKLSEVIHMDVDIIEDRAVLGFCVMGGIFGEGIDLRKDSLIGVAIVGCGTPLVCNEREILRLYYDEKGQNGFDFAYRYPGMNKVLQAAGRVIRTEEDTGVVALLDDRFLKRGYRELFPREWRGVKVVTTETVNGVLNSFWAENTPFLKNGNGKER